MESNRTDATVRDPFSVCSISSHGPFNSRLISVFLKRSTVQWNRNRKFLGVYHTCTICLFTGSGGLAHTGSTRAPWLVVEEHASTSTDEK